MKMTWLITKTGISIREVSKKAVGPQHMLAKADRHLRRFGC